MRHCLKTSTGPNRPVGLHRLETISYTSFALLSVQLLERSLKLLSSFPWAWPPGFRSELRVDQRSKGFRRPGSWKRRFAGILLAQWPQSLRCKHESSTRESPSHRRETPLLEFEPWIISIPVSLASFHSAVEPAHSEGPAVA